MEYHQPVEAEAAVSAHYAIIIAMLAQALDRICVKYCLSQRACRSGRHSHSGLSAVWRQIVRLRNSVPKAGSSI